MNDQSDRPYVQVQGVRLDTGAATSVPGPHEPQPYGADLELRDQLAQRREEALLRRDAHQAELDAQVSHHREEIDRYERVVNACNSAMQTLDGEAKGAFASSANAIR